MRGTKYALKIKVVLGDEGPWGRSECKIAGRCQTFFSVAAFMISYHGHGSPMLHNISAPSRGRTVDPFPSIHAERCRRDRP